MYFIILIYFIYEFHGYCITFPEGMQWILPRFSRQFPRNLPGMAVPSAHKLMQGD